MQTRTLVEITADHVFPLLFLWCSLYIDLLLKKICGPWERIQKTLYLWIVFSGSFVLFCNNKSSKLFLLWHLQWYKSISDEKGLKLGTPCCVHCNLENLPFGRSETGTAMVVGKDTFCEGIDWLSFLDCMIGRVFYGCVINSMLYELKLSFSVSIACPRDPNKNQMPQIIKLFEYSFKAYINIHQ